MSPPFVVWARVRDESLRLVDSGADHSFNVLQALLHVSSLGGTWCLGDVAKHETLSKIVLQGYIGEKRCQKKRERERKNWLANVKSWTGCPMRDLIDVSKSDTNCEPFNPLCLIWSPFLIYLSTISEIFQINSNLKTKIFFVLCHLLGFFKKKSMQGMEIFIHPFHMVTKPLIQASIWKSFQKISPLFNTFYLQRQLLL